MIEDEMVGWHYQLDGHEFEQALGISDGQRSLAGHSPWGRRESDTTEQLTFFTYLSTHGAKIFAPTNFCLFNNAQENKYGC